MLHEFQKEFGHGLRDGTFVPPDIGPVHRARFALYRESFLAALVEVLDAAFPVVRALVGAEFFAAVAAEFARSWPPEKPQLSVYGRNFPAYLAALPQVACLAYLPDLARLEWAHVESYFAPAPDRRIGFNDLLSVADDDAAQLRFLPAPSLRLIASKFAVHSIWRAHQNPSNGIGLPNIDLAAIDPGQAEAVRLVSDGNAVRMAMLDPAGLAFIENLVAGRALDAAQGAALLVDADFDFAPLLAAELAAGSFIGLKRIA